MAAGGIYEVPLVSLVDFRMATLALDIASTFSTEEWKKKRVYNILFFLFNWKRKQIFPNVLCGFLEVDQIVIHLFNQANILGNMLPLRS